MARVAIEQLSKTFSASGGQQIRAVDDLSLTVEAKELVVLAGPSGCGKTTTLRLIAGLETPDRGSIHLDGAEITKAPPQERDLAMVFQSHALYPHMTARENIAFGLKVRKHPKGEIAKRIAETSAMLRIEDCLDRLPADLSGGQRQRVALGRALVLRPRLLLLDEPLSNLDAPLRARMRADLLRFHKEIQFTMIYVTHDHLEAMTLGQRIAVMREGKLEQVAPPMAIYRQPSNRFVAGFFGAPPMNFFECRVDRKATECFLEEAGEGAFRISLPPVWAKRIEKVQNKPIILGIRPEDIRVGAESRTDAAVEARLELIESFGHETWLHLVSAGHRFIARAQVNDGIPEPGKVIVSFDLRKLHFFDPETGEALV